MKKVHMSEETRYGLFFVLGLVVVLVVLVVLNFLFGGDSTSMVEKEKDKTVILKQMSQNAKEQKAPSQAVVNSVREVIKQKSYSTSYMEIGEAPKTSAEAEHLGKQLAEENVKRKAPGIKKEKPLSPNTPVRFLDESTPRDRGSNAIYVYFIDLSGALWPRFCVQTVSKKPLQISKYLITADNKKYEIAAKNVSHEITGNGISEWYDVPLDKAAYDAVQAMIKAKKSTLTSVGSKDKSSREVTKAEKEGFTTVLKGFAALGGNLSYLTAPAPLPAAAPAIKEPHKKRP